MKKEQKMKEARAQNFAAQMLAAQMGVAPGGGGSGREAVDLAEALEKGAWVRGGTKDAFL